MNALETVQGQAAATFNGKSIIKINADQEKWRKTTDIAINW